MPDIFANITVATDEMIDVLANVLETRASIPSQQAMLHDYLSAIPFPAECRILEVGCGTGPITRVLSSWPNAGSVVGIDPSPGLLIKAEELSEGHDNIHYEHGDGKHLRFEDESFDVVIMHTLLTHVPGPEDFLTEAHRVLRSGGFLGVCDGDFSTATLGTASGDPLEACTSAFVENFVNDPWLVRRLSSLVQNSGFEVSPLRSYGLTETISPGLTMTWVDRGADALEAEGRIGSELAEALKQEGRRRAADGTFFGYMAYAALTARK